jgi:hypothetical protein
MDINGLNLSGTRRGETKRCWLRGGAAGEAASAAWRFSHRRHHTFAAQDNTVADLVSLLVALTEEAKQVTLSE